MPGLGRSLERTKPADDWKAGWTSAGALQFYPVKGTDRPMAGLIRFLPYPGPAWPSKELGRVYLKDGRQFLDDFQAHVCHGPLDPAEVGPVHLGVVGQLLLRDFPRMPDATEVHRKKLA
jgi:hypothetical protein